MWVEQMSSEGLQLFWTGSDRVIAPLQERGRCVQVAAQEKQGGQGSLPGSTSAEEMPASPGGGPQPEEGHLQGGGDHLDILKSLARSEDTQACIFGILHENPF